MSVIINKELEISGGTAPYEYEWISGNPDCFVSFSNPSGSTDSLVQCLIEFVDESCIGTNIIQFRVVDKNGCKALLDVPLNNPCINFNILSINSNIQGNNLELTATTTEPYKTVVWNYNNQLFTEISKTGNSIVLNVGTANSLTTSSLVYVTATNASGCEAKSEYAYSFCTPTAYNEQVTICKETLQSSPICLKADVCSAIIDWSTLSISSGDNRITVPIELISENCITLLLSPEITEGNYQANWGVKDTLGNISNKGIIFIAVTKCQNEISCISAPDQVYTYNCEDLTLNEDKVIIDLSDVLSLNNCDPNWDSFVFLPQSAQTLISNKTLSTSYGTISLDSNYRIVYNYSTLPSDGEVIQWSVSSINGDNTGTVTLAINYNCSPAPIAIDDTFCISCHAPYPYLDILANDTGNINPSSITITQYPPSTEGMISIDSNNKVMFIPTSTFTGISSFKYKVSDFDSNFSTEATVNVEVICAGQDTVINVCNG